MIIDYDRLAKIIQEHSGLTLDRQRFSDVDKLFVHLITEVGVVDSHALLTLLEKTPTSHTIWQTILRRVTVGETYFMRNRAHFKALREHVLPHLIQERREQGYKYINIWSAGCSTGEEPYSVAMVLHELLPDIDNWSINILGTDINQESLDYARRAQYRSNSFRSETSDYVKGRYFTEQNGTYILHDEIKRGVSFSTLNLIADDYPSFMTRTMHQDILLCRNVTIYFNEDDTRRVVQRFYQAIRDDGWLVVGHAEPGVMTYKDFEPRNFENTVMYQKPKIVFPIISTTLLQTKSAARVAAVTPTQPVNLMPPRVKEPVPVEVTIEQIQGAVNRADWDVALSLLSVIENREPMNPQIHYLRGLVLMNSGLLDEARQALRRSLYCDPSFAMAHYAMGEVYFQEGRTKQANRSWMLSNRAIAGLDDEAMIADDLTVAMFRHLLEMRLGNIEDASK